MYCAFHRKVNLNILFATLVDINSLDERGIYQDLMNALVALGHKVYVVSPAEKRRDKPTSFTQAEYGGVLKVRIGNIQKTGKIEKGISTLLLELQYVNAVKRYLHDIQFDLIIYSTPPITLVKLIKFIKQRDGAVSYLLLKDIFPQNAVDIELLSKGLLYNFFRKKEIALYALSDYIGCMSQANVDYLIKHNPQLDKKSVHVCPNSITPVHRENRQGGDAIRKKYGIPTDCRVFVYGGNLGKPQCVSFIVACLKLNQSKDDRFFVICGDGTDAQILSQYIEDDGASNAKYIPSLPKSEYDELLSSCEVGLIFLDHRFTIPNFPSRLLSYMEYEIPVLACTDTHTDVGKVIEEGRFGWWCESSGAEAFTELADKICGLDVKTLEQLGRNGRQYLEENYLASKATETIIDYVL